MGGCSSSLASQSYETERFEQIWKESSSFSHQKPNEILYYTGWKIVRIVLISTFKDFRNERIQIHQLIEQTIQPQMNKRKIFLQLENLNSNQKSSFDDPENIYLLDHLISECHEEAQNIIYIHLFGNCCGMIIDDSFTDLKFLSSKALRPGLTMNEISLILSGKTNPNALYLIRNSDFLIQIPFNQQTFEDDDVGKMRAEFLVQKIKSEMPKNQIIEYKCTTEGFNDPHHKQIILTGFEEMLQAIKQHVVPALDNYKLESIDTPNMEMLYKKKRCELSKEQELTYMEALQHLENKQIIVILGNHGSGKTNILTKIQMNSSFKRKCFLSLGTKKTSEEYSKEILKFFDKAETDNLEDFANETSEKILICVDDADKNVKELKKMFNNSNIIWVLAMKKCRLAEEKMIVLTISSISHQDSIQMISKFMDFGEQTSTNQIRSNTKEMAEKLYFNASLHGMTKENVEEGKDDVQWSKIKCKILGSLIRFGASSEKVTQLASHSSLSICEAELSIIESEAKGHLLIATLCFLSIANHGLSEIHLRTLLFPEESLLPKTISRKYRTLPFEYDYEKYGHHMQISALNWRFIKMKLEHLFYVLNKHNNHFVLDDLMKKCVWKKFLTNESHLSHFKKLLERFGKLRQPWLSTSNKNINEDN